jgi:hypothetical protein
MSFVGLIVSLFRLLLISFTSGASSPEWVKPAAEGGGLLVFCFQVYLLAFSDLRFCYMFPILFYLHSHYS